MISLPEAGVIGLVLGAFLGGLIVGLRLHRASLPPLDAAEMHQRRLYPPIRTPMEAAEREESKR